MTSRHVIRIFCGIGIAALLLALAGHFIWHWKSDLVGIWTGIGVGYLLAGGLIRLMPRWWREHCDEMYAQPAGKRYLRALWPIMIGYSLTLFASIWFIKRGVESVPLRALVAVLPAIPLALMMGAALRYLREVDELQRRIETEAIGIASLLTSLLYFGAGLLQKAKVFEVDAGVAMIWVFPLLAAIYGIAKMRLTKRYL